MAEIDVVSYLASKGYQGRRANGPEVLYPCFLGCGESASSSKRKLYINTETGLFTCFVCGESGGTYLLQKHFGDDPKKPEPGTDPDTRRKILNWAAEVGSVMLSNNDKILMYLMEERGLSPETIVEAKLGYVGGGWSLTQSLPEQFSKAELANTGLVWKDGPKAGKDFFYSHLLIPYLSRSNVVQIRGRQWGTQSGGKYMTGPGEPVLLYGVDDLDGADDAIIVEGEFDRLALRQALRTASDDRARKIAVVGLAGANGFKEGFEAYFANVKRVYLGLDPDDTGKREAAKLKERLGTRARILELPSDLPKADWSDFLLPAPAGADEAWHSEHPHAGHTWRDVMGMLGNASGKRLFSVPEAGFSYRQQRSDIPGMKTGFDQLDSIILPGLLPGQIVVVLAKTGTGKTIFLCNLAWNMRQYPLLFVSLEMTREEVYERLRRIAHFWNPRWSDAQVEESLKNIFICDENRLSEKDLETLLDEFEIEAGVRPQVAFIDYLGYYARGVKGVGQYEKTTNAVMQLKAMAKAGRLVLFTPSQVNRGAVEGKPIDLDDARDSGAIEETADFLLAIFRPDEALNPAGEDAKLQPSGTIRLTLLKSRHGGKGRVVSLKFDNLHLAMVEENNKPAARKVSEHNNLHWRSWKYEDLRKQELRPIQSSMLDTRKDLN